MVDVLVVYSYGSHYTMLNLVNLCLYQTNLALSQSGTNVRLRLVGLRKDSSYSGAGKTNFEILEDLRFNGDGQLDSVHNWRDVYGADLVHYISDDVPTGMAAAIGGDCTAGFSISKTSRAALAGDYVFAHEIGP